MKPSDLLGVLVRAIGIWQIAGGLFQLPNVVSSFQFTNERQLLWQLGLATVSLAGSEVLVGCFLFFAANWIVQRAYPESARITQS